MKVKGIAAVLVLLASTAHAQDAKTAKTAKAAKIAVPSDNYDQLLQEYLQSARLSQPAAASPDTSWMTGLFGDLRARRVNDLVTINVIETLSAVGSADSTLDKNSTGSAAVPSLFGVESKFPGFLDPSSLASLSASTSFKGGGSTARSGSLSAVLTARVAEVLPNGDLAVEGVRELDINGDRQIIVLTGVVRTADIGPGNVVPSTAIGQMRIRYFGRGLIKDNLNPGWLVRVLNKIF
jgi:flagellar L-ring protein precursor FlgH